MIKMIFKEINCLRKYTQTCHLKRRISEDRVLIN